MKYLVTGVAGFIGSHFVQTLLNEQSTSNVVGVDSLSYAGDVSRLNATLKDSRFQFVQADICDDRKMGSLIDGVDIVFNFAAQSHVDRSLQNCSEFFTSNCYGTQVLLNASIAAGVQKFIQISTDEVYGSRLEGAFSEGDSLNPTNPYSVSKAAAEQLVLNASRHDGLPIIITRGANTYGPYQYPEKLIPFFVSRACKNQTLPVYGDGMQVRDWLHVNDHCRGVLFAANHGQSGEIYNIPGNEHLTNIDLTKKILKCLGKDDSLIEYVQDRKGHDRRYAMSGEKIKALGFSHEHLFNKEFEKVLQWYLDNVLWLNSICSRSKDDAAYFANQYSNRPSAK